MRTREQDTKFLEECRMRMDVLLNEVQNAGSGRLTANNTSSLVAWVKQQAYPLQGEELTPILPGERGCFQDSDVDKTTRSLLDGAMFVDGGGRGLVPMKARAQGDCFFVSVSSLAFGGRCSSVAEAERYALPLRAATVHHAIVHMEDILEKSSTFRQPTFYDAAVWHAVSGMGEMEKYCRGDGSFQLDLARLYLVALLRSVSKELTPCPPALVPLLVDALGLPIRTYHPGLTLGSVGASRKIITPLDGCKQKGALPLLLSYTICTPEGDLSPPHPFNSLYEYKERCFSEPRRNSRGCPIPGTGYSYVEFSHFVPILPPRDLRVQMEKEAKYLREGSQGCPTAHVLSTRNKELIAVQTARDAEAEKEQKRLKRREIEERRSAEQIEREAATGLQRANTNGKSKFRVAMKAEEGRLLAGDTSYKGEDKALAVAETAKTPPVMPRNGRLAQEKVNKAKKVKEEFLKAAAAEEARGAAARSKVKREAAVKEEVEKRASARKAREVLRTSQKDAKTTNETAASSPTITATTTADVDPTKTATGSTVTSTVPVLTADLEGTKVAAFAVDANIAAAGAKNHEGGPKRSRTVFWTALSAMCCVSLSPAVATVATVATTAAVTAVVATAVVRDLRSAFCNPDHKKNEPL